jgi:WD40 repeat protein
VAWSPDGTRLAGAGVDGTVRIWDAASGRLLQTHSGHSGTVVSVAWSPDGTRLASGGWDRTVRIWDATSGRPLGAPPLKVHTRAVSSVAWSPDGTRLASASTDHTVRLWDGITEGRACRLATQVLGAGALQQLLGADRGTPKCANPDAIQDLPPLPLLPS